MSNTLLIRERPTICSLNNPNSRNHPLLGFHPFSYIRMKISFSLINYRSSHLRYSIKKGFLKNFSKFTGKHLCSESPLPELMPTALLKRRLRHRCFPVNFAKFLRTPFLRNTSGLLLLQLQYFHSPEKIPMRIGNFES